MTTEHRHAICRRTDGSVDELTFDVVAKEGRTEATNFRTIDGLPLALGPGETIEITLVTEGSDDPD